MQDIGDGYRRFRMVLDFLMVAVFGTVGIVLLIWARHPITYGLIAINLGLACGMLIRLVIRIMRASRQGLTDRVE